MTERLGSEVLVWQNGLERVDRTEVLRHFRSLVLIMCGDGDTVAPPSESLAMAALIPHARCVTVPTSGHLAPIECPKFVAEGMRKWLTQPESMAQDLPPGATAVSWIPSRIRSRPLPEEGRVGQGGGRSA